MIFKKDERFYVKSAGTSPASRIRITEKLINWADVILVVEKRHKEIIRQQFQDVVRSKEIKVLFIPDDFEFVQAELIELLEEKMKNQSF